MKNFLFFFSFFLLIIDAKNIEGNSEKGADLFKKNCTSCHSLNQKIIGPPLSGVTEKRSREWLHKWIINNKSLRESGDKEALSIYKEYGNLEMNTFPQLNEQKVDDILSYIQNPIVVKKKENHLNIDDEYKENKISLKKDHKFFIKIIIFGLSLLFIIILCILYKIQILTKLFINDNLIKKKKKKNPLSFFYIIF
ncbi:c-type cytochrome [Blattabacterium cuenoti]|uniref:c-type cytochrome n=1 Tax=Blattabacterium cuenoti TaxID=1653831 RepID=UPI001EEA6BEA|nr:cytochrome c [Blattabacterium cuenoti]